MTTAERGACARHWLACPHCRQWIALQPPDPEADGSALEAEAREMARHDLADPELLP